MQTTIPPTQDNEYPEVAWGIPTLGSKFEPLWINRAKVGAKEVRFDITHCGICHSDIHVGLNDFGRTKYPCVPGHELAGLVTEVGNDVTKVKVGDKVGVGCMTDSCLDCDNCKKGDQQYCEKQFTGTYGAQQKHHVIGNPDTQTFGGYAASHCVREDFIIRIPDGVPLDKAGPIMCAGITTYDPLKHWGATSGKKMNIGVIGIGGLGTMGIKLAKALGHRVTAISTSINKKEMAKEKGADAFVASKDPESIKAEANTLDLILNTASSAHQVSTYIPLLRGDGTIVQLGLNMTPHALVQMQLLGGGRKSIAGSLIGGVQTTEELLQLCDKHQIFPDTELVDADKIDWVWEQLNGSNAEGVRYVIDVKKSLKTAFVPKVESGSDREGVLQKHQA